MSSFLDFLYIAVLLIIWIWAGGLITNANVKIGHVRKDNNLNTAYWLTFSGAFITWTLIGLTIVAIIYVVTFVTAGTVLLFGSGAGEVGVAGAGAAEGGLVAVEGAEAGVAGVEAVEGAEATAEAAKEAESVGKEAKTAEREESELSKARRQAANRKQKKKPKPKTQAELNAEAQETPDQRQDRELKEEEQDILNHEGVSWIMTGALMIALGLVITTGILAAIAASNIQSSPYFQQNPDNNDLQTAYKDCIISASMCLAAAGILVIGFLIYWWVREKRKKDLEKAIREEQEARVQAQQERQQKLQEIRQAKLQVRAQQNAERKAEREQRQSELEEAQHQAMLLRVYQQAGITNPGTALASSLTPTALAPTALASANIPIANAPTALAPSPLAPPPSTATATPTESQCYLNLGLKTGAKKKEVLATYQNLLTEYHPSKCTVACCGPNLRRIKESKDKIVAGTAKTGCLPIIECAAP